MKNLATTLFALVLTFTLVGCGDTTSIDCSAHDRPHIAGTWTEPYGGDSVRLYVATCGLEQANTRDAGVLSAGPIRHIHAIKNRSASVVEMTPVRRTDLEGDRMVYVADAYQNNPNGDTLKLSASLVDGAFDGDLGYPGCCD